MDEVVKYAHKLAERAGQNLGVPFYMYESAATKKDRKNLATIRAGEYEGLPEKLKDFHWKPDYGPAQFNPKSGATAIGARDFLIAYNVNLNTTSVRRANSVAFDIREKGRLKRKGNAITGEVLKDKNGEPQRTKGTCKGVKAIGWYIDEYEIAQISMNITNINVTPLHKAFEATCKSAQKRGLRVTGSELVGLVPLKVMLDAGKYFLKKQKRSIGVSEEELVKIAIKSLGLDELGEFDPQKKIIEYQLVSPQSAHLLNLNLREFSNETAAESPAPGGGSISAYVGALGISLAAMVANLSSHKRGWDDQWEEFSDWAERAQVIKDTLLKLVDEDTNAFNAIMDAFRLPKGTADEKTKRSKAIQDATRYAIEIPFKVMQTSFDSFEIIKEMAKIGNPNSVTDAGVGALCARAAVHGSFLNVKVNTMDLKDKKYVAEVLKKGKQILQKTEKYEKEILKIVNQKIK